MARMELERPLKLNLNSIILIVQLVFAGGAAAAFFSNSYADYRRDAETIAALKLEVAELKKVDRDFSVKLSDSQFATATKLIGIERDVDYIKKTVERLEKAVTAPAPR